MALSVAFYDRQFKRRQLPAGVVLNVDRYKDTAQGGPDEATITASGDAEALWELLSCLRCPIEIIDDDGTVRWWGYLHEATLNAGRLAYKCTLDGFANRVRIDYGTSELATGYRYSHKTGVAEDPDLVAEFGKFDLLETMDEVSESEATARRDTLLSESSSLNAKMDLAGAGNDSGVTLLCRGWIYSLAWQLYNNNAGSVQHWQPVAGGSVDLGRDADSAMLAQSLSIPSSVAWTATTIRLKIDKTGDPMDAVAVELRRYVAGNPQGGSILASGTFAGESMYPTLDHVDIPLSVPVTLNPNEQFWALIYRQGGTLDEENYYRVQLDSADGYAAGELWRKSSAGWASHREEDAPEQSMDMLFQLYGTQETSDQIVGIVHSAGEFLTGVDVEVSTGVFSTQYRDGTKTALDELLAIVDTGAGGKRILMYVDQSRRLRVYKQPEPGNGDIWISSDGTFLTATGDLILPESCPAGVWARPANITPSAINYNRRGPDVPRAFIETMEFNSADRSLTPSSEGLMHTPSNLSPRAYVSDWSKPAAYTTAIGMAVIDMRTVWDGRSSYRIRNSTWRTRKITRIVATVEKPQTGTQYAYQIVPTINGRAIIDPRGGGGLAVLPDQTYAETTSIVATEWRDGEILQIVVDDPDFEAGQGTNPNPLGQGVTVYVLYETVVATGTTPVFAPSWTFGAGSRRANGILFPEITLTVGQHPLKIANVLNRTLRILKIDMSVEYAPEGGDIIATVSKNGGSITEDWARPRIPAGANSGGAAEIKRSLWYPREVLSVSLDAIGYLKPGANLTISVVAEYAS